MRVLLTVGFALLGAVSQAAFAGDEWTGNRRLSGDGSSVGIDTAGNATVTWSQPCECMGQPCAAIVSQTRTARGTWGAAQVITPSTGVQGYNPAALNVAETGEAAVLWIGANGLLESVRPIGGRWSKPVVVIPNETGFSAVSDRLGDTAVLFGSGAGRPRVAVRLRKSQWREVESFIPATAKLYQVDVLGVAASGDVVVTWETYENKCVGDDCNFVNFVLHASRLRPGSTLWEQTLPPIPARGDGQSPGYLTFDDTGRVGLAINDGAKNVVLTQVPGSRWSVSTSIPTTGVIEGFASDANGNATLIAGEGANATIIALSGSLATRRFTRKAFLSGAETVLPSPLLAVSGTGSVTVLWSHGDPAEAKISTASLATSDASWGGEHLLASGLRYGMPSSVAAAGRGQAVASWGASNADGSVRRDSVAVHLP